MKNPISLDGLVSWLEQQDPETTYDYLSVTDCLVGRYFKAVGLPVRSVSSLNWTDTNRVSHPYPYELNVVANWSRRDRGKGTYETALILARAMQADPRAWLADAAA